ncbi:MAG: T9SS type A sorting domain-containing protein [Ignavibacteria bacterium]|nr:T9SS type A sorting domain-containing protein [Ignavibacteria bacterium]
MAANRFLVALVFINSFPLFSIAQEAGRFTKPHDFYPENSKIISVPQAPEKHYSDLPNPYTNINLSGDPYPQNEPSVKFNAKYSNQVLAAWRDFRTGVSPAQRRIGYSYSTDGGSTWSVSQLIPALDPNHPLASDPVVCSDTNGNFYVATISLTAAGALDILVFKSTDGGVTFPTYSFVQGGGSNTEDKEWMACDLTKGNSAYKNNLYVSWTRFGTPAGILMTKSTNGGVNWSSPVQVSSGNGVQGSDPAIGPNGEVYVVWVGGTTSINSIFFNKSTTGGASFGTEKIIAQGILPNIIITSSNVTFPSIATDITGGPRNGYVYVTWCDSRNGDPDIFIMNSTNGGDNWSIPVRVNNDVIGNGKLQCWPWISVNEEGKIAILYYDSRNGASNNIIEAWLARSTDGGQTFVNEKLSAVSFTATWPNVEVRFGDYINVDYKGSKIVPVWTDLRAGGSDMDIYTAVVDIALGVRNLSTQTPSKYILQQNYPNPFNPATKIKFSITENGKSKIGNEFITSLKVYDVTGKEVAVLLNESLQPGTYEAVFDGSSLNSGVYFYRLISGDFKETKKMLLIK